MGEDVFAQAAGFPAAPVAAKALTGSASPYGLPSPGRPSGLEDLSAPYPVHAASGPVFLHPKLVAFV